MQYMLYGYMDPSGMGSFISTMVIFQLLKIIIVIGLGFRGSGFRCYGSFRV